MQKSSENTKWYKLSVEETLQNLDSSKQGISSEEATERLSKFGPNELPKKKPVTILQIVLSQFKDPLIYILLIAGFISIVIGEPDDAIFILAVVILNAILGTTQEYKAEKSAEALLNIMKEESRVIRNGETRKVNSKELVPGDIILAESGDRLSADIRLIETNNLSCDESFLTGESTTVEKNTDQLDEDLEIGDRKNLAFAGSTVITGRAKGVVIATGRNTEIGKIAEVVTGAEQGKAPLVIRMEKFTRRIAYIVLVAAAGFALIRLLQGYPLSDVFFLAVALSVSAIPEGLPVALTVALSVATSRMAKRNVIVRKLEAVESLGSCTVIASDKTGTLTVNQQTARLVKLASGKEYEITGEGYNDEGQFQGIDHEIPKALKELIKISVVANEGTLEKTNDQWHQSGDAMDVALLSMAYKSRLSPKSLREETRVLREVPYESENRYSAAFYEEEGRTICAMKGATETILVKCKTMLNDNGGNDKLDSKAIEAKALSLAEDGYRVLAFASGKVENEDVEIEEINDLVFIGLVGFIDPLRAEVKDAVRESQEAGVRVIMITGDHPSTALAIAKELKIIAANDKVVTGKDLENAGDHEGKEFTDLCLSSTVFARVSPVQKLHIVEALKREGHFVAVTGDGVNDAPALQRANIGVAMGSGTDVAKDTGSIIITDDNFASIVSGIEEGRFAFANVRKVIYLLISTGAAELLLFVLAVLFNVPLPLVAVQILWLNLVTNGIQDVALAFEKGEPGVMRKPPRRTDQGIFDRLMIGETILSGFSMGLIAFVAWMVLLASGMEEGYARNLLLLLLVLMQNVHVFNCRSETESAFRVPLSRNYILIFGVFAAHGLHLLAMNTSLFQNLLGVSPVSISQWLILLACATPLLIVMELFKAFQRKKTHN
ncbi:cation-translocating P-type ATPase [Mesotoga sp. UBA6090]|nr:HAD-IC family P-type ATPase [Mesotoga sp. UBA6090]